jgi:protein-S-isoprenylcysteine O-methyltransferase Ste14
MKKFYSYFCNLILIWFSILIYYFGPFYSTFLGIWAKTALLILAFTYTIFGFIFYLFKKEVSLSKGALAFSFFKKFFLGIIKGSLVSPEKDEKNAALFILVKFFFLPLMFNFCFSNFLSLSRTLQQINLHSFTIIGFNSTLFPVIFNLLFFVDTLIFTFGYTFESGIFKNKLRSVEPTFFGWVVALACYPPFNGFTGKLLGWYSNDYYSFSNPTYTFILRIILILLISIYVWASIALGTKASNLTNRGIVSKGPYAIVRHPAYISKNLAWFITILPLGSIIGILSGFGWALLYHLRAITEERHLRKDPDYLEYCQKVKYRYIPGIY